MIPSFFGANTAQYATVTKHKIHQSLILKSGNSRIDPAIGEQRVKRLRMHPKTEKTKISPGVNLKRQKANQASQELSNVKRMPNNDSQRIPVGARLYPFRKRWQGAAHEGIIKIGLSWTWKRRPPKLKRLRQRHSKALDLILKELRQKRVIEKARQMRWQSRLFTVPKRDPQKDRLILDLSVQCRAVIPVTAPNRSQFSIIFKN